MKRALLTACLLLWGANAYAQSVPNHAIPIGRGAGTQGFKPLGPCTAGTPIVGAGASTDPACYSAALGPLRIIGQSGAPDIGSNNTGIAWFQENAGSNGLNFGFNNSASPKYGWIQPQFTGSAAYYNLSLNPLGGNTGIGTTTPAGKFHVLDAITDTSGATYTALLQGMLSAAHSGSTYGVYGQVVPANTSGNIDTAVGVQGEVVKAGAGGTITNAYGLSGIVNNSATGTITNAYALKLGTPTRTGVVTNDFGVYQEYVSAKNYFAGNVGIGTSNPATKLDVNGTGNIAGAFTQSGGYPYLGSFNSAGVYPRIGTDLAVGWNFTSGGREVSLWNTDTGAATPGLTSFAFNQLTGASTKTTLMTLMSNGNVGIGTTSPAAQLHTTGSVRFAGLAGLGTGCPTIDNSGNLTGVGPCSGGGIPNGGTIGQVILKYDSTNGDANWYNPQSFNLQTRPAGTGVVDCTGMNATDLASAIGSFKDVSLPIGCTIKISTNVTVGAGVTVRMACGASFSVDNTITLTIRGGFVGPPVGCPAAFTGAGTTTGLRTTYPEWWGAKNDGSTDDIVALRAATASIYEGGKNGSVGSSILYLSCGGGYNIKGSGGSPADLVITAETNSPIDIEGCSNTVSGIVVDAGATLTASALTIQGTTSSNPADFRLKNFYVKMATADTPAGKSCVTFNGSSTTALQGYMATSGMTNVWMNNCRIGLSIYNTRTFTLDTVGIWIDGVASSAKIGILVDATAANQSVGEVTINGGQIVCNGGSSAVGTGVRLRSETAGQQIPGWRYHGVVFEHCDTGINGTMANLGKIGDHWIDGGTQFDGPINVVAQFTSTNGSAGYTSLNDIQFNDVYVTAAGAFSMFKFSGTTTAEMRNIQIKGAYIGGQTTGTGSFIVETNNVNGLTLANIQVNGPSNGSGGPPYYFKVFNTNYGQITGNVCDPNGNPNAVADVVGVSGSTYITMIGNSFGLCASAFLTGSGSGIITGTGVNTP